MGLFAIALAAVLGGCGMLGWGDPEVRYKVIVEVEDGGVARSGSSVWSWTLSEPTVALASPYSGTFEGEAVAVDLSGGRTLFAILRGGDGDQGAAQLLPERVFGDIGRDARGEPKKFASDRIRDLRDIASRTGERRVLDCTAQPDWCPMLVTFADIDDPKTVQQVDPANLAASFGPGVTLRRISVELTDEPVTTGIRQRLAWLESQRGSLRMDALNAPPPSGTPLPFGANLSEGDFTQGMSR